MFNRVPVLVSVLTAWGLATLVVGVACRASEQKPFELDTKSPDSAYRLHFKERIGFPRPTRHEIQFDLFKEQTRILKDEQLYEGGVYDSRFSELYPEHLWVSPSALRFGSKDNLPKSQHDELVVENATDRTITYLRVNAGKYETFLLLELKAGSFVTLEVEAQTDKGQDLSYIGCKGRFADGTPIGEEAGNFLVKGKYRNPAHYSLRISDNGVSITSKEFESTQSTR